MKLIVDTQVFLWWLVDDPALSGRARRIMRDAGNTLYLSAVSAWEIAIKAALGRLELSGEPTLVIPEQMAANSIEPLPVQISHALHVYSLPAHHRDPFDRMLVAQSQIEGLPIITSDVRIGQYEVEVVLN
ncbi:MAG: type II toxin-antitoxin system VapC family toxin [Chloroflexi bacterium]|nr:type II toxin-antitoxin system VapC family toxin [Chloroflexota bacterium]